jgi:hypothetical protein
MGNLWFELTGEYYKSVKKLESTASLSSLYTSSLMEIVLDAMHLCMYAQIYTVWDLELEAAE